ncbi:MAG TPA: NAD(P)/FAD-dependent oxidoreductase [Actinomycetota bacterium]|nr:NAD(P)/FAD-dependent oxidoreductase [Actinomycetota bacterium]
MSESEKDSGRTPHVVIVGAGFAGLGCARELAKHDVRVTLLDQHNYHQFQPLLYQVATAQLATTDIAFDIRQGFRKHPNVDVKMTKVVAADPDARSVTFDDGGSIKGDYLVVAAGSQPNFFGTPGAEHSFPLYSLDDAQRLRSRIIALYEDADKDPSLIDRGALTFVIVGAGATGTEVAGALSEMIRDVMPTEYHDLAVQRSKIILVDHGHAVLAPFSDKAHEYAAKALQRGGVQLRLGTGVTEIRDDAVSLSDGTSIPTRCVIWGGGLMAAPLAGSVGVGQGRGGRIDVEPDLTVPEFPKVYALGDFANIPSSEGGPFPQLGSVALQSGQWAAKNILADIEGKPRRGFHYHDKGIMAMIGKGAAVAEVGEHRHELHGAIAFSAWLGVHVVLLSGGGGQRLEAFVSWAWDYFSKARAAQVLDRSDAARIDWGAGDDDIDDKGKEST